MKGYGLLSATRTRDAYYTSPERMDLSAIKNAAPTPFTRREAELVAKYPAGYWAVQEADGGVSVYRMSASAAASKDGVMSVATESNGSRSTAFLARAMSAFKGKPSR